MILFLFFVCSAFLALQADDGQARELTTNELAEALDIHWWCVKVPADFGPNDRVYCTFVSSDGKEIAGGDGPGYEGPLYLGPDKIKPNSEVKVFCWEEEAAKRIKIKFVADGTSIIGYAKDYFALPYSTCSAQRNGEVLKPREPLLTFDPLIGGKSRVDASQLSSHVTLEVRIERR